MKVGDRVRIKELQPDLADMGVDFENRVGTVFKILRVCPYPVYVSFDMGEDSFECPFGEDELEVVED